ncbi:MAG: ATP-binding cassette domain-containing protein [Flavobacterium sp.]
MDKHILEVDSVQKHYGNRSIVSDVYLKCETGDIIGFLGRNGSGKSTLLKIIFSIVPAEYKFVRIDGIVKSSTAELLREISYLPQENFIPDTFSVKKAIRLTLPQNEIAHFCQDEMISQVENKKIGHLSGGELRYLEIKLILSNRSKFALLDEPYNGLSPAMIDKINTLIREKAISKGIVITDHSYENVIKVSSRLLLMKDGKTYSLEDKKELVEKGYLKEGFL